MTQVHPCKDDSELVPLYPSRGLFLKPIARMNVSVHYPELKQTLSLGSGSAAGGGNASKSVSSWDIMERIKALVSPEEFISLKVVKNTLEFIRFEGDLENRVLLKKILQRLDGKTMKVTGFKEQLKIRTCESKLVFPSKYDWDSFFRDAKNMNEMKAGERPDTIHFQNLPVKWFTADEVVPSSSSSAISEDKKVLPSERFFRKVWEGFGDVRAVDIPACDPYRSSMSQATSGIKTFASFSNDNVFEGYVQYKDYISFVKAMDALRGSWIFYQERGHSGKSFVANIKVDFDKSKHLSDESIRKRKMERDKLAEKDKAKEHAEKLSRIEREVAEKKRQELEKKQSEKAMAKIEYKIAMEERKYLIAQRKLEAIRLMDYLFEALKKQELLKSNVKAKVHKVESKIKDKGEKIKSHKQKERDAVGDLNRRHRKKQKLKEHKHHRREKTPGDDASDVDEVSSVDEEAEFGQSPYKIDRKRNESPRRASRSPVESGRKSSLSPYRKDCDEGHAEEKSDKPRISSSVKVASSSVRYLGDWEVKAKSTLGSQVQVSNNYVPVGSGEAWTPHHEGHRPNPEFPMSFYRGRGGPGGRFFREGPTPPFRGGRGGYMRGSYNPNYSSGPPHDYYNQRCEEDYQHSEVPYRGRGRGRGYFHRGSGSRGRYSNEPDHDRDDKHIPVITSDGPTVRHDYTYLDELDRAYEKYFSSITRRNDS